MAKEARYHRDSSILEIKDAEAVSDLRIGGGEHRRVYVDDHTRSLAVQGDPVLLTVVIPTYNEKENVPLLLYKLGPRPSQRSIRYWAGLSEFCTTCSFGVMANFSIAHEALQQNDSGLL